MTDEIKEIVQKASPTEEEMISAVEYYIKDRKNIDVDINLYKKVVSLQTMSGQINLMTQYKLLHKAFDVVANYYCAQIFPHQNRQL